MKFAIGYQAADAGEESFADIVRDYGDHIAEVYFPWGDMPSGRAALSDRRGYTEWSWQQRLEEDLTAIRDMGIGLDLLFNANCYGGRAVSTFLEKRVASVIEHLGETVGGVDTVTTTSPAIARTVRKFFPDIEVRASVNMRLGTIRAMELAAAFFDGYYVQREYNRNIPYLQDLKAWADKAGKRLYMLANSGCLAFCPSQTFHDNMVAHEQEIDETVNIPGWTPHLCWDLLRDRQNWSRLLQNTWVRPEDLPGYEKLFPVIKLATRMHAHPRMVIHAYAQGSFRGNLLDLFEPGFSPALAPFIIDNQRFPADWADRVSNCGHACHTCGYCRDVLADVLMNMAE